MSLKSQVYIRIDRPTDIILLCKVLHYNDYGDALMRKGSASRTKRLTLCSTRPPAATPLSAAVFLALYGFSHPAHPQDQAAGTPAAQSSNSTLQEVVVTATRRAQTLEEVPYSITAIGGEQLSEAGVTDIASLTSQVPGLSMFNLGARDTAATTPIIRGISVTAAPIGYLGFRTFEQSPVGVYIGNSPIDGYFQLDDVQRVEVLRGPQGTLYGAGALGGALRIIPNAPQLNTFSGNFEVGGGTVAHSSGESYTVKGMLNVPIGDTLAFRASGRYAYEPGFINVYGILERPGSPLSGIPTLANPADPANSPGVFTGKNDWNYTETYTGRASVLWKPVDPLSAELAFIQSKVNGDGGPTTNSAFPGGPYPIDPRVTFPGGGNYQDFVPVNQPFTRTTNLTSLDLSYDAGFATLSSTSSYFTTTGSTMLDQTYGIVGLKATDPGIPGYYAGNPINPRFVNPSLFGDSAHTFTQEFRLVSTPGPDKPFDYVVGLYYEHQVSEGSWNFSNPGSPEYAVAQGCTAPYYAGASFPNCLLVSGPGDVHFAQVDIQTFEDKSEFAELTWHFMPRGQITFGGRHFEQSFTDEQSYLLYTFDILLLPVPHSAPASKNIWKVNPSYEYADGHYAYALWSQGFRRGGANALPTSGIFKDNPQLLSYTPDSTNNYEVGLKGHFADGVRYAFDVFDIQWDKPQIGGTTPDGGLAVWNANRAQSKGFEFDVNSRLFLPGLSITMGGSYTDAKLTENYSYAANNGAGVIVPGAITGTAGQQLPGSSKVNAVATLNYEHVLVPGYNLTLSLNDTYRNGMYLSTFSLPVYGQTAPSHISGMNLANLSASVTHLSWRAGVYVTNLADKRVILEPPYEPNQLGNLTDESVINQPREIQVRVGYSF